MQLEGGRAAGVSYRDDSEASFGSWAGEMQAGLSEGRNQSSHIKRTARKTQGEITSWCFSHKNRQPGRTGSQCRSTFPGEGTWDCISTDTVEDPSTGTGYTFDLATFGHVLCSGSSDVTAHVWFLRTGGVCFLRMFVLWHEANSKHRCSSFEMSSIWERLYDLFICNKTWPCFSRGCLTRRLCQLADRSVWMKPQANSLLCPVLPSSLSFLQWPSVH